MWGGLNEGDKCLRVRNMLRQWKVDIVCLQEAKMEYISSSFVRNLWGCPYADWCFVASRGALDGILLMWDRRVVTKIEVCVGEFVQLVILRMWRTSLFGRLRGYMVRTLIILDIFFGRSWLVLSVGGMFHGVLEVTLMSLIFLVKGQGEHVLTPQ
jgi:hypothetical protein